MPADRAGQADLSRYSGEFFDAALETRFRRSMQGQNVRQLRISLFVAAGLFLMIGLFDYQLLGPTRNFYLLIVMRGVVAAAFLLLAAALGRHPQLINNTLPLNSVIFLLVTSLIFVVPLRPETINTQLTAVVAATLALYLFIPNRIPCAFASCVYLGIGFLLAIHLTGLFARPGIVGTALTLVLANVIGLMTALRLNHLQREQFASLLAERKSNQLLQKEIEERQRLEQELRHLAQIDDLTGLNKRRWFFELAGQERRRSRRNGTPLGLCMVDLDHFKTINDNKGHAAGDKVLAIVAALCREGLRDTDVIGRFGGEEFVIALPGSGPDDTHRIAEHLRARIERYRFPEEFSGLNLTVTVGTTQVEPHEETLEPALARADQALYLGKRKGRNTVITHEHCTVQDVPVAASKVDPQKGGMPGPVCLVGAETAHAYDQLARKPANPTSSSPDSFARGSPAPVDRKGFAAILSRVTTL